MLPWILLDTAKVPGDANELKLWQRGTEFSMRLGSSELMNSRLSGSEEMLASLALERVVGRRAPRIMIGGLGMGFTLRAALPIAAPEARITVVELIPEVVAWARGPLQPLFGDSLDDARVAVETDDVLTVMKRERSAWDAILLDVDNGPEGLTRESNDAIYAPAGLASIVAALRPGGVCAVWSAHPSDAFTRNLRRVGLAVDEHVVRASRSKRGARHTIWLATRPGRER